MRLGKTQVEFMNGYYITDIFDVMAAFDRVEAERWLMSLNIEAHERMEEKTFKQFVDGLIRRIDDGKEAEKPKFDVAGFEAMKLKLKHGL